MIKDTQRKSQLPREVGTSLEPSGLPAGLRRGLPARSRRDSSSSLRFAPLVVLTYRSLARAMSRRLAFTDAGRPPGQRGDNPTGLAGMRTLVSINTNIEIDISVNSCQYGSKGQIMRGKPRFSPAPLSRYHGYI